MPTNVHYSKERISTFRQLRIAIHKYTPLRKGIAIARRRVDPQKLPGFIRQLSALPLYRQALAPVAFPRNIADIKRETRLVAESEADEELYWNAAVIATYKEEINYFAMQRSCFENAVIDSDFAGAEKAINNVIDKLGYSLWVIENSIALLQLSKGVSAQKEYLHQVLETPDISRITAYLTYWFSFRCEEHVTAKVIASDSASDNLREPMKSYARYYLGAVFATEIDDPISLLRMEENSPIIDRFNTLIDVLHLCIARDPNDRDLSMRTLSLIDGIDDRRLATLRAIAHGFVDKPAASQVEAADHYVVGAYDRCMREYEKIDDAPTRANLLELVAKSSLFLESTPSRKASISSTLIKGISDVLALVGGMDESRARLEKLSLVLRGHPMSNFAAAFLSRKRTWSVGEAPTELEKYYVLGTDWASPRHASVFAHIVGGNRQLAALIWHFPTSSSVRLQEILQEGGADGELEKLNLPSDRKLAYVGHRALTTGDTEGAITAYTLLATSSVGFWALRSRIYLLQALEAANKIADSLVLMFEAYCFNSNFASVLPIAKTLDRFAKKEPIAEHSFVVANLFYVLAKHESADWERDLSDAYDLALSSAGKTKPSQLFEGRSTTFAAEEIFFLRHVCSPRVLEDSIEFESVAEILQERVRVCQQLISVDPANSVVYRGEIRSLTLDIEVAKLYRAVQTSKMFVDFEGIREECRRDLTDTFYRFCNASDDPTSVEKTKRRLQKILKDEADLLKDVRLPATERLELFDFLIHHVLRQQVESPRFGLDAHIGARVRHGALDGELRGALSKHGLLTRGANPESFLGPLGLLPMSKEVARLLEKAFSGFEQRIGGLLEKYREQLIQVQSPATRLGLIRVSLPEGELPNTAEKFRPPMSFDDFYDRTIDVFWSLVEESLHSIRDEINVGLRRSVNGALDALERALLTAVEAEAAQIKQLITVARLDAMSALDRIKGWFRRPVSSVDEIFTIGAAIAVAKRQIGSCYPHIQFFPDVDIGRAVSLPGSFLNAIVVILFNLFENAISHSGGIDQPDVSVEVNSDGDFEISVANKLADCVDLYELQRISNHYNKPGVDLAAAMKSKGSGLWKIKRICAYEMSGRARLTLGVGTDRCFRASLIIDGSVGYANSGR